MNDFYIFTIILLFNFKKNNDNNNYSHIIIMSLNEKDKDKNENKEKDKKLSYENDLFMYYDYIKDNFTINRDKLKSVVEIFKEKMKAEEKLSSTIKQLCENYISKYNKKSSFESKVDLTINKIINNFLDESNIIDEKNKFISENLIVPFNGILSSHKIISDEIIKVAEHLHDDFKLINEVLKQKVDDLMKIGKNLENSIYKLEKIKISDDYKLEEEIEEKKNKENEDKKAVKSKKKKSGNINENKIQEEPLSKEELIEKYKKNKEKNMKSAKNMKVEYESFINVANSEKDKYLKNIKPIYDQYQILDEQFIQEFKEKFKKIFENEIIFLNRNIDIRKNIVNEYINLIDVEKEMNSFINSKFVKFSKPMDMKCVSYTPQIVLKNRNDPIESVITQKVNTEINAIFLSGGNGLKENEENNYLFFQKCIKLILDQKDYEKDKLLKLLETNNREQFLTALNQCRVEGIFELPQKSFDNLCFLLNYLVNFAIQNEDFESIKTTIILSQTFYVETNKKLFLNSGIASNKNWKDKVFWEKIIDYAINYEINNSQGFSIFLEEDSKARKSRVESAITSNIITYLFNMKLFKFPEDKYKELIEDLINKYKIEDGEAIYGTLNSINMEIENEKKKEDNLNDNSENK